MENTCFRTPIHISAIAVSLLFHFSVFKFCENLKFGNKNAETLSNVTGRPSGLTLGAKVILFFIYDDIFAGFLIKLAHHSLPSFIRAPFGANAVVPTPDRP